MSASNIPAGKAVPFTNQNWVNTLNYVVTQKLRLVQTATIVRVEKCTKNGENDAVGFVDVTPMVHQIDAFAKEVPHSVIHHLPYVRIQGGKDAVIIDPKPGDLGIAVFASRDISRVKSSKKPSLPGSWRTLNYADGMYIGGLLNGDPEQWVRFHPEGIEILSPKNITLDAPTVNVKCQTMDVKASTSFTMDTPQASIKCQTLSVKASSSCTFDTPQVTITGRLTVQQDATAEGISVAHHTHTCPDGGTSQPR